MKRIKSLVVVAVVMALTMSCNNSLLSNSDSRDGKARRDKSKKTVIDPSTYVDFTVKKNDARNMRREDLMYMLNGAEYKNGNSSIKINAKEGTVELQSDSGVYKGKKNCQVYGVFSFDIQAASEDCLYIRKNQKKSGFLLIDSMMYRDDAVPDLAVCLPLYGYSKNRIEISSVMDGYIVMPSGTYWKK
jgi:hypothetical protein